MHLTSLLRDIWDRLTCPAYLRELRSKPSELPPPNSLKPKTIIVQSMDDLGGEYLPIPTCRWGPKK